MAERINCPNCGKELKVPSRLVGRKVVCPRCHDSFRLSPDGDGLAPPHVRNGEQPALPADTNPTPKLPSLQNGGKIVLTGSGGLLANDEPSQDSDPGPVAEPTPPPIQAAAAVASPAKPTVPAVPTNERTPEPPPVTAPAVAVAKPIPSGKSPPTATASRSTVEPERKRKSPPPRMPRAAETAKFVAAEAADTRVRLGEDGKLPDLVLQINKRKDAVEPSERNSNPLVLIGVLCLSISMSVILLLYEPGQGTSTKPERELARELIKQHYTGTMPDLKPHEDLLRQALQAYNRQDYATEQRLYRQVLEMLRDESHRGIIGLTRRREGATPPSDRHLEEQLSILLRKD